MNAITIVGINNYFGSQVFKVGQTLYCVKEPDNIHDEEAIKVVTDMDVLYGYVANSIYTVAKGCKSAGRIYDSFNDRLVIKVLFIIKDCVIAEITNNN